MNRSPLLAPLGDRAVLVRFGERLDDEVNRKAVALARQLRAAPLPGVEEVVPNLVSVLVRYAPEKISFSELTSQLRLRLSQASLHPPEGAAKSFQLPTHYGQEHGPDLNEVAQLCEMDVSEFIERHAAASLRVLATGFAPGFVYCGLHENLPPVARRLQVRARVPAGSILFAAGQTAVTATEIPTGWHVIGWTDFRNFDAKAHPPTKLDAGDHVCFPVAST